MKNLIITLLVTLSAGFVNAEGADEKTERNLLIIQAIVDSLKESDLDCKRNTSDEEIKASLYNFSSFFAEDFTLTVVEGKQPVITIKKETKSDGEIIKTVVLVTTDSDFKTVTKLVINQTDKLFMGKKNTGTIIEPKYVDHYSSIVTKNDVCQ